MSKTDAQRLLQRRKPKDSTKYETEIPEEFLCPITQDVMKYPVLCSDGFVYEKGGGNFRRHFQFGPKDL